MKQSQREKYYKIARESGMNHEDAVDFVIKIIPNGHYHPNYPLILMPTTTEKRHGWFVSQYNEYPIYESAEGGYYYAGVQLTDCHEFVSRRKAMKYMRKVFKDVKANTEPKHFYSNGTHTFCGEKGCYIGEGVFYQLEHIQGKSESGYQPYC